MSARIVKPLAAGLAAVAALLGVYFAALTLVSGWAFTMQQFQAYWYFITALAAGFGVQVGLFAYLHALVHSGHGQGAVLATSGTTSTAAMISCCAHYLVNMAPVVGAAGLVTFVAQYQVQLFWIGLAFNAAGMVYIGLKVVQARRQYAGCMVST